MRIFVFTILFICLSLLSHAQVKVRFTPTFHEHDIELDKTYFGPNGEQIQISTLRFYVSNISSVDLKGSEKHGVNIQLVDLEDSSSLLILESADAITNLQFFLGTDSTTNVSGILDGPLDPINGMYWAWNSGYINFKLEGILTESNTSIKSFEFHVGGYLPPYQTVREFHFSSDSNTKEWILNLDIDQFLNGIDLSVNNNVMIPGNNAVKIADLLVHCISLKSGEE